MSFERRPKRIAGPGFHVNVRYDDATVAQMRTNLSSNPKIKTARSDEVYDIKEMELLVTRKDGAMYYDGYTHCFSAVNGYPNTAGLGETALKNKILNEVRFVGVAVTEYKPTKAYSEQGFVSQIGGVVTLINESKGTIFPGEKVKLGLELGLNRNITRDKGIPREKVRFCIEKATDDTGTIINALKRSELTPKQLDCGGTGGLTQQDFKALRDAASKINNKKSTPVEKKAASQVIKDFEDELDRQSKASVARGNEYECKNIAKFLKAYREENELIIGKALGLAKPGDRVEVLLQPRHSY